MASPVIIVFTGEGKGKTEAALGLLLRALGADFKVAFIQFIKIWPTSEDKTLADLQKLYPNQLFLHKGGKGFYRAGKHSAKNISPQEHQASALATYNLALDLAKSGTYDLVILDEVNNAVVGGLLDLAQLKTIITTTKSHLALTGRNFPQELLPLTSITTNMQKLKHHFDTGTPALPGLDF